MKNNVPNWFKKAAVYQINPRTFSAEGTLKAVTDELPFLAELGFEIMYLCPIFEEDDSADPTNWSKRQKASGTDNPKNPYRMNNYFEIDAEYGNMTDLRAFVCEAHRLGMKVILDLVYFHIGPNAPILKQHPEFAKRDANGKFLLGNWNFPVFDYSCEGLREYLYSNIIYFIGEIGVDGFRCDVGDSIPLDFWREGKRRMKTIHPNAVMINEGEKPNYLSVFDANYGFHWHGSLYNLLEEKVTATDIIEKHTRVEADAKVYENTLILRDMENHDTVTDQPYRVEKQYGNDCMELIMAVNYTIDGIPMVYCGNELADTAHLSMFANRFHKGTFETTDRTTLRKTAPAQRRMAVLKTLNALKKENEALYNGKTVWIPLKQKAVLAFERVINDQKVVFIGNFSAAETEIAFKHTGVLLLSNKAIVDGDRLTLAPYAYIITTA